MKQILIAILFLSASICSATGWNDYTLDIGDGYSIFRANSMDVGIVKEGHVGILMPYDYQDVGPVFGYITTDDYIFAQNYGRTPRNLFEGDAFEDIDTSREFYFIIFKKTDEVTGPLLEDDFMKRAEVTSLGSLNWIKPRNPNFWTPLLGAMMFLGYALYFFSVEFFLIVIPVLILIFCLIRSCANKR